MVVVGGGGSIMKGEIQNPEDCPIIFSLYPRPSTWYNMLPAPYFLFPVLYCWLLGFGEGGGGLISAMTGEVEVGAGRGRPAAPRCCPHGAR